MHAAPCLVFFVFFLASGKTDFSSLSSSLCAQQLPKVMELVGLGYSTWFVYRYVLYKDSRKELVEQFDALKEKVSGEF